MSDDFALTLQSVAISQWPDDFPWSQVDFTPEQIDDVRRLGQAAFVMMDGPDVDPWDVGFVFGLELGVRLALPP